MSGVSGVSGASDGWVGECILFYVILFYLASCACAFLFCVNAQRIYVTPAGE